MWLLFTPTCSYISRVSVTVLVQYRWGPLYRPDNLKYVLVGYPCGSKWPRHRTLRFNSRRVNNFHPMMSYRRVQKKKKATNCCIRSLVMVRATSCQRKNNYQHFLRNLPRRFETVSFESFEIFHCSNEEFFFKTFL